MAGEALSDYSDGLRRGSDGIWRGDGSAGVSYPSSGNEDCSAIEDGSFWFEHRNRVIGELVAQFPPLGTLFDVGGGNGFVAQALQERGHRVVVVEPGEVGARNAKARGLQEVVCATFSGAGLRPRSLPAVALFDVIEHVEGDSEFLRLVASRLAPGGRVYLTVPSHRWLWSWDDVAAGHHRRYSSRRLGRLLDSADLVAERASHFFAWLPLPVLVLRCLPSFWGACRPPSRSLHRDHQLPKGRIGELLRAALAWELGAIARGRNLSIGASLIVVAKLARAST